MPPELLQHAAHWGHPEPIGHFQLGVGAAFDTEHAGVLPKMTWKPPF